MDTAKTIEVLNSLIEINNDRIEGYQTATKETEETDLKALFSKFARTSEKCKAQLEAEVLKMGGTPTQATKISGKFFRVWMDVKAAITGKDRRAIMASCAFGEDQALAVYHDVIHNNMEYLNNEQQTIVYTQHLLLKSDHDTVRSMRDMMVNY